MAIIRASVLEGQKVGAPDRKKGQIRRKKVNKEITQENFP